MDRLVRRFLKRIESNTYLSNFIPNQSFIVLFQTQDKCYKASISKGKVELLDADDETQVDVTIVAELNIMKKVVLGTKRLRKLEKYEMIRVEGSYRAILFIEAVMWLCREKNYIEKIA